MSVTEGQLLPDDVLLEVMQYLSVEDVFACRLVCKKLEALARHPSVWRHRRIDRDCHCPVLRLAPCLGAIVCKKHGGRHSPDYCAEYETTKCAVTSLDLEVSSEQGFNDLPFHDLALFTQVLRNQIALGHLKHVTVRYGRPGQNVSSPWRRSSPLTDVDAFWDALAQSSCLQSLRFQGFVPSATRPLERGSCKSSLLLFKCLLTRKSESFVKAVLATHTDTLEEVSLTGYDFTGFGNRVSSPGTTELLARMPRLRSLKYDRLSPIEALAACKTLKDVSLAITPAGRGAVDQPLSDTLKFLSEANQLRALSIEPGKDDSAEELIEAALASSALSLEHLSYLEDEVTKEEEVLRVLIRALPRLPALRQLTWQLVCMKCCCDKLLLAITPLSAPTLRRLELISLHMEDDSDSGDCGHRWLHRDAVRATLEANPLLHIHLRHPQACFSYCDQCAALCHLEAGWNFDGRLVLFAHEPGKCPAPEDHTAGGRNWRSIHMPCNRLQ